jgi:hypothetical protein
MQLEQLKQLQPSITDQQSSLPMHHW